MYGERRGLVKTQEENSHYKSREKPGQMQPSEETHPDILKPLEF